MKIVNSVVDTFLSTASCLPLASFLSGPTRIILSVAQVALNLVASAFLLIPSFFNPMAAHHFKGSLMDIGGGVKHICIGISETAMFFFVNAYIHTMRGLRAVTT